MTMHSKDEAFTVHYGLYFETEPGQTVKNAQETSRFVQRFLKVNQKTWYIHLFGRNMTFFSS